MKKHQFLGAFFALLLLLWGRDYAHAQGEGKPFVSNYAPKQYRGHIQNWAILQDPKRGIMYVGNGNGVMEYDGSEWRITELPGKTTARSMSMGADGRLYLGTSDEFGYLDVNAQGKSQFTDLSALLPDSISSKITDIWETFSTSEYVFFRTYYHLFRYSTKNGQLKWWETGNKNRFFTMFVLNDRLYIQKAGIGLMWVEGDELKLAPQGDRFVKDRLSAAVHIPYKEDTIILSNRNGRCYKYPFSPDFKADSINLFSSITETLKKYTVYTNAVRLQDGGMALGSLGNGVLVFDKNHQFIRAVNQKDNGFGNDVVYTITTDRDGAVWIGGANGVGRIDLAAEISFWNEGSGLKGTVYCIERHPVTGFLHVFTSSGAFYFEGTQIKEITELSTQQCWHAINFTNPDDPSDKRMLASYGNIAEIKDGKATDVLDGGISAVFKMYKDPTNPYKVWIGYGDALGSMRFEKGKWVNEGRIEGIDDDCRSMSLDKQTGDLWVGTFRKGVLRLIKKEAGGYEVKRYNAATGGVLSDKNVIIAEVADQRVFCTDKGLCVYNPATDKFEPWKELGEDYANGNRDVFSMQEDAQGNLWLSGLFVNTSPAMAAYRKPDGTYSLDGKPFKKVPPMMTLGLFTEADGTVWLGGSEGLFRYKPKEGAKREEANFHTLIRQVRIGQDSVSFWGNYYEEAEGKKIFSLVQHESTKHTFGADFNTVAFHFAAPFFDNEDQTVYQFYLEGFDEGWSPWEKVYQKEYTNLPGGEYVFRVKARNLYGNESTEASYRFKVLAPWYLRWYAILGYVVLLSALIYAIVRINAKRLKRENERLERLVEARTAEIRQKNTELLLQKEEIEAQAEVLQTANVQITEQKENLLQMNVELSQQKEEIMAQAENLRELNEEISVVNTDLSEKQLALEKAYDDIQTLSHIGQEITSILDLREIISTVYARVNQLMEASGFGVGVYNPETQCIEFNGFMEKGAPLPDHADDVHNDAFLSARVFKSQQPFFSNNTGHDFDDEHERLEIMEGDIPLSVMYMPLQFQGKPIGVITVQSFRKNAYSETDMSMLRSLASYASIAIANAQSYEVIKAKNRHITDSIRYSLTMQTAFLPSQKDLSKALGEYMLIYRPKDIVSGDFYWMEQPEENVMFLAVVDCTGHGVPGSFMSIIGSTILSEAVNMLGLRSPAAILEYLHQHVVKILSQEAHENDDGMDLALIRVERKGEEAVITFSGAKNDLLYVQQNTQALQIVSGDRKQIGGIQKAGKQFSDKVLQLKAGDSLFMLTDGIVDQNDGTTRKFGSLRMREILGKYAYLPKAELQQFIEDELRQFMGEAKQRDDITLLGFKL